MKRRPSPVAHLVKDGQPTGQRPRRPLTRDEKVTQEPHPCTAGCGTVNIGWVGLCFACATKKA